MDDGCKLIVKWEVVEIVKWVVVEIVKWVVVAEIVKEQVKWVVVKDQVVNNLDNSGIKELFNNDKTI